MFLDYNYCLNIFGLAISSNINNINAITKSAIDAIVSASMIAYMNAKAYQY